MYVVLLPTILYFFKSVRGSNHIIAARVRKVARFLSFQNDMFSLKFSGRYHLQKVLAAAAVQQRTATSTWLEVVLLDTRQC